MNGVTAAHLAAGAVEVAEGQARVDVAGVELEGAAEQGLRALQVAVEQTQQGTTQRGVDVPRCSRAPPERALPPGHGP